VLKYFEKVLPLRKPKMCSRYILWAAAELGISDVIQDGHHLGFYPTLEIINKNG